MSLSLNEKENNDYLKQRVSSLEYENAELRQLVPTITMPEDQVAGQCISVLLKKAPTIFFPKVATKQICDLMSAEFSSDKSSLPFNILVVDEEGETQLLSSYVKKELEVGLDNKIIKKGKKNFEFMVNNIAQIQGNFWKQDGANISTVPALLKRLNEGDAGKEWITRWNGLGEDYKKYIAASVLYRISNQALPKKYEDIESYLKVK